MFIDVTFFNPSLGNSKDDEFTMRKINENLIINNGPTSTNSIQQNNILTLNRISTGFREDLKVSVY
jgi:hypothetical protein